MVYAGSVVLFSCRNEWTMKKPTAMQMQASPTLQAGRGLPNGTWRLKRRKSITAVQVGEIAEHAGEQQRERCVAPACPARRDAVSPNECKLRNSAERVLPAQAGKAREIAIGGTERQVVLDREGREMRVRN